MVKNRHLAKSISDAAWSQFTEWLEYLGKVYGRIVVGVPPQYTSQNCSNCGQNVKKSLSVRTHICQCGCVLDRDHNAAINILDRAHQTDWLSIEYRRAFGNSSLGRDDPLLGFGNKSGQDFSVNQESPVF
ncbi:transposase [Microseira wollei NIES-4236]|uniref:Transposase n=1 Tax=Microseira wollei NIES-4236 TaxID=2530354 RepID=A0AAV3WHT8_9CYAN|nr:transposase [Microseira wollei NIES-4236]